MKNRRPAHERVPNGVSGLVWGSSIPVRLDSWGGAVSPPQWRNLKDPSPKLRHPSELVTLTAKLRQHRALMILVEVPDICLAEELLLELDCEEGMANFQREGAISNAHVGRAFEHYARGVLAKHGLDLDLNHKVAVGIASQKKAHAFDLGSENPKVLVECKAQTWTAGNRVPSAKMKNWAEAMFYFHMAPPVYRKIFLVERSVRATTGETLLSYFLRTHFHLIPPGVELWDVDRVTGDVAITRPER